MACTSPHPNLKPGFSALRTQALISRKHWKSCAVAFIAYKTRVRACDKRPGMARKIFALHACAGQTTTIRPSFEYFEVLDPPDRTFQHHRETGGGHLIVIVQEIDFNDCAPVLKGRPSKFQLIRTRDSSVFVSDFSDILNERKVRLRTSRRLIIGLAEIVGSTSLKLRENDTEQRPGIKFCLESFAPVMSHHRCNGRRKEDAHQQE